MTDYSEMRNAIGDLWVGPRHPRANTTFEGTHMVADEATWDALNDDPTYSFEDAGGAMGFCVVGDDPTELEQTAIDIFTEQTTALPKIEIIADRWGEPLDNITPQDRAVVKGVMEWCEVHTHEDFSHSAEMWFAARHPNGRYGVLFEAELDDDFVPTPEQIERARNCAVAPGEFTYVPPNSNVGIWYDRAAYWVFFPGRFFDVKALNETARNFQWLWTEGAEA